MVMPRKQLTFNGKTQSIHDWSMETGITYHALHARFLRYRALERQGELGENAEQMLRDIFRPSRQCTHGYKNALTIGYDDGSGMRTLTFQKWSWIRNIPKTTIATRYEAGYTPAQILGFEPLPKRPPSTARIIASRDGRSGTVGQWVKWTGINKTTIERRIKLGWPDDKVVSEPVRQRSSRSGRTG